MGKRLFSLALVLVLILGLVPATAGAAGGPKILCEDVTAAPGQYVSVDLRAEELEALASLDLEIYYDPEALDLTWHSTDWLLSEAIASVHTAEPGVIRLSAAIPSGVSGSDTLLHLQFYVSADCAPGNYPLTLAVGEAYDVSLSPVTIAGNSGSILVTDTIPTHGEFRLALALSQNTLAPGETFTAILCNDWCCGFASCDLTLTYDATLFRVKDASVSHEIGSNTIYSLNTDEPGRIRFSCASTAQLWCHEMLTVELQALEDAEGTARLTAAATDVYDESRIPYQPGYAEADVSIRSADTPVLPQICLETEPLVIGEETASTLVLESGSNLAAADFRLEYDSDLLECLGVSSAAESGMVVINPNFSNGSIRFSYVNEAGTIGEMPLVTIRWKARETADRHYTIRTTLIDPVDPALKPVSLSCPDQTGCILRREQLEPSCTASGGKFLICVGCGERIALESIPPLGHDYGEPEFFWTADHEACTAARTCRRDDSHVWEVDCTVTHTSTGNSCTEPGTITYTATADFGGVTYADSVRVEKDVLGHDYTWTVVTEPGCETEGLRRGICTRCGDTREEAIAPVGHNHEWSLMPPPTCTEPGIECGKCSRCGDVRTRDIPALGHDWQGTSCTRCGEHRENPFTDVPEGSFYYAPVIWAVEKGITNGTTPTTFGPNDQCMRAHVVTFLWRAAGSPEPSSGHNPFADVKQTDFYYTAVLWAVENGITNGLDATHFGPYAYCNRAQVVTFLHRTLGNPLPSSQHNPFVDVPEGSFYHAPVLWAVENAVTNGLDAAHFGPNAICNRAQIVTFLYRAFT